MSKLTYFKNALKAELWRRKSWVISCFALLMEGPDDWKKDPYPYRLVQQKTGHFYVNPENTEELLLLETGLTASEPPFSLLEGIDLAPGDLLNVYKPVRASLGNAIINAALAVTLKGKIEFITSKISGPAIEAVLAERLADDPDWDDPTVGTDAYVERPELFVVKGDPLTAPIYVKEYLDCADAMMNVVGYSQICVSGGSPKVLLPPPGLKELRAKLLEENKDRLNDPAVVAKIDAELIKHDAEYLKGDPGEGFLISKKSRNTVRRKLFLMQGAEIGFGDGTEVDLIQRSLSEGWDISKFPVMMNTLRAGSHNRGAQTMLGGEAVKWLLRASSVLLVEGDDCGVGYGLVVTITSDNASRWLGRWVIGKNKTTTLLTKENVAEYYNKIVMIRSGLYCRQPGHRFCKKCVGIRLARKPDAISSAVTNEGSIFLAIYMAAAHAKDIKVEEVDYLAV